MLQFVLEAQQPIVKKQQAVVKKQQPVVKKQQAVVKKQPSTSAVEVIVLSYASPPGLSCMHKLWALLMR